QIARHESSALHIIVRTRYVYEIEYLHKLGANEVIPEEFETSLEILTRTLHEYQVSRRTIDQTVTRFRSSTYQALRQTSQMTEKNAHFGGISLNLEIETTRIESHFEAKGKMLKELSLPSKTGVVVLAVRKNDVVTTPPPADYLISENDMLILVGTHQQLMDALDVLEGPKNKLALNDETTKDEYDKDYGKDD